MIAFLQISVILFFMLLLVEKSYIGHGVDAATINSLREGASLFFNQDSSKKATYSYGGYIFQPAKRSY
jgi:hypothetical protein